VEKKEPVKKEAPAKKEPVVKKEAAAAPVAGGKEALKREFKNGMEIVNVNMVGPVYKFNPVASPEVERKRLVSTLGT
jgi:hypothetical protein